MFARPTFGALRVCRRCQRNSVQTRFRPVSFRLCASCQDAEAGARRLRLACLRADAVGPERPPELALVADLGRPEEADLVLAQVGLDSVLLIRIRAPGRGCSYPGDCRGSVGLPGVPAVNMANDGDPAAFRAAVVAVVGRWLACLRGQAE